MSEKLTEHFLLRLHNITQAQLAALTFKMAEQHPDTFIKLVSDLPLPAQPKIVVEEDSMTYTVNGIEVSFSGKQMQTLLNIYLEGKASAPKVTAIKTVREYTGLGLKEAKDLVEDEIQPLAQQRGWISPS